MTTRAREGKSSVEEGGMGDVLAYKCPPVAALAGTRRHRAVHALPLWPPPLAGATEPRVGWRRHGKRTAHGGTGSGSAAGGCGKGAPAPGGGRTGAAASGCVGEGKGGDGIGSGWDGGNLGFLGRVRECVIYTGGY